VAPVKLHYDARGLAEPDAQPPRVATITGGQAGAGRRAVFDAAELSTRLINLELRRLVYEEGIADVTIRNPGAKHSLASASWPAARSLSMAASATSAAA